MFKKIIPLLMLAVLWAAAPASAQDSRRSPGSRPEAPGLCYSASDARGKVIKWAQSREQCQVYQGQSWAQSGRVENIRREPPVAAPAPLPANPIYQQPGAVPLCYFGLNGQGKVIKWAKTKEQCRNQSNGKSWGHSGHYENFYRESRDTWRR